MSIFYKHKNFNGQREVNSDFFKIENELIENIVLNKDFKINAKYKYILNKFEKNVEVINDIFKELSKSRETEIKENMKKIYSIKFKDADEYDRLISRNNILISGNYQPRDISIGYYFNTLVDSFENFRNHIKNKFEELHILYNSTVPDEIQKLINNETQMRKYTFSPLIVYTDLHIDSKIPQIKPLEFALTEIGYYSKMEKKFVPLSSILNYFNLIRDSQENLKINVTKDKIQYLVDYAIELMDYLSKENEDINNEIQNKFDITIRKSIKDFITKYFVIKGKQIHKNNIEVQITRALTKRNEKNFHKSTIELDYLKNEWEKFQNEIAGN